MTRSPASRLAALLTAVLFFLAWGGEAAGVHPCPHHSGVHAAPEAGGHHADGAHHAPEPDAPEHGGCTCASGCPSASGTLLPPPIVVAGLRVAVEWTAPRAFPPAQSAAPRFLPYLLPYAQAPPLG